MTATKVLILGATGYIGGSVLRRLKDAHPEFEYTALVRNPKDNQAVEALGVTVVNDSTNDLHLVQNLASRQDIVVNCADIDGLELAKALIAGLASKSSSRSKHEPIMIHTSGSGVVSDAPTGEFNIGTSEKIWNDNHVEDIKGIDRNQPHRKVDLAVFSASQNREVDTYIVAPSTIYGKGRGPVRNVSQQIPFLIREAVKRGQPIHVGKGTNLWNNVHIDDLADLYLLVLDYAISGKNSYGSYSNFFWGSVGEHVYGKVVSQFGQILYAKRLVNTAIPRSVTLDEVQGIAFTATNSRTVGERGVVQLGWKSSSPSLEDALADEVELVLSGLSL